VPKVIALNGEQLPVPEVLGVAELAWGAPQLPVHRVPLRDIEPPGAATPVPLVQPGEAAGLKPPYPAFDGARGLAEEIGDGVTGEPVRDQQDPVQPVIVAGLLGPQDFLLQGELHDLGIGDLQFAHAHVLLVATTTGRP
jgi:hypothetical protein